MSKRKNTKHSKECQNPVMEFDGYPSPEILSECLHVPVIIRGGCSKMLLQKKLNQKFLTNLKDSDRHVLHVKVANRMDENKNSSSSSTYSTQHPVHFDDQLIKLMSFPKFFEANLKSKSTYYLTAYGKDHKVDDITGVAGDSSSSVNSNRTHDPFYLFEELSNLVPNIYGNNTDEKVDPEDHFSTICDILESAHHLVCVNKALWVSNAHVSTPTHYDDYLTVSVYTGNDGKKFWYLAPREATDDLSKFRGVYKGGASNSSSFKPWLYDYHQDGTPVLSSHDSTPAYVATTTASAKDNVDYVLRWFTKVELRKGDIFINPAGYWHGVETMGDCIAVNWWWLHNKQNHDAEVAFNRELTTDGDGKWVCSFCSVKNEIDNKPGEHVDNFPPACLSCCHIRGKDTSAWRCKQCCYDNKAKKKNGEYPYVMKCQTCDWIRSSELPQISETNEKSLAEMNEKHVMESREEMLADDLLYNVDDKADEPAKALTDSNLRSTVTAINDSKLQVSHAEQCVEPKYIPSSPMHDLQQINNDSINKALSSTNDGVVNISMTNKENQFLEEKSGDAIGVKLHKEDPMKLLLGGVHQVDNSDNKVENSKLEAESRRTSNNRYEVDEAAIKNSCNSNGTEVVDVSNSSDVEEGDTQPIFQNQLFDQVQGQQEQREEDEDEDPQQKHDQHEQEDQEELAEEEEVWEDWSHLVQPEANCVSSSSLLPPTTAPKKKRRSTTVSRFAKKKKIDLEPWVCPHCTYENGVNEKMNKYKCKMCELNRSEFTSSS